VRWGCSVHVLFTCAHQPEVLANSSNAGKGALVQHKSCFVTMAAVGALERCRSLARELVAAVNAEVAGGVPDKVRCQCLCASQLLQHSCVPMLVHTNSHQTRSLTLSLSRAQHFEPLPSPTLRTEIHMHAHPRATFHSRTLLH
jgi:hypothetical protein